MAAAPQEAGAPQEQADRTLRLLADIEVQSKNGDLGGFSRTITKCLAPPKVLHEVVVAPSFWFHAKALLGRVSPHNDPAIALALAEIGRLQAALKSKADHLRPMAADLLAKRTPPHFCYGDSDQATFAAKGWACSGRPVDLGVAARTVVMADAPKPLVPWLELALSAGDVSTVIEHITSALVDLGASEASSPKNRSNRLQRLLKALRSALDADRIVLDTRIAATMTELVARAFRGVKRSDQYPQSAKGVEELMSLVLHLIRMDLRLLTEPAIYNSVSSAKGWLPDGGWLRFTKSSTGAAKLRKILLDGLVILLKQHNPNRALLQCHRSLSPSRLAALDELKAFADGDRQIPSAEREWLASGGETSFSGEEREIMETDDVAIAMALLAVEAMPRCELFNSDSIAETKANELVDCARNVRKRVLSVAGRRNLRTFGEPGEVVKFSPHAHRLTTPEAVADEVRIVEPGVESQGSFGARVVVPAIAVTL